MNIFGINGGELIVLIVLALLLLGPEKIPEYLRTLREWIHKARVLAEGAKEQFKEETGTDFDEVDWQKYDPRQYDPRRVIREALSEPIDELEASLQDAKDTIQDAADTVTQTSVDRPQMTQAQILAAAVPIDQLAQQTSLPDPNNPDADSPEPVDVTQTLTGSGTVDEELTATAIGSAAGQNPVITEPAIVDAGTPFDSEAT